jgi:hypothetical protein
MRQGRWAQVTTVHGYIALASPLDGNPVTISASDFLPGGTPTPIRSRPMRSESATRSAWRHHNARSAGYVPCRRGTTRRRSRGRRTAGTGSRPAPGAVTNGLEKGLARCGERVARGRVEARSRRWR